MRVEAHRLRRRLAEYYQTTGAEDPIEILLPPGSYVPVFRRRDLPSGESLEAKVEPPESVMSPLPSDAATEAAPDTSIRAERRSGHRFWHRAACNGGSAFRPMARCRCNYSYADP